MISVLLISVLLLTAGGVLILTTSMSGTNAIDSTAEMQAYYGAEAGLQAALNVLRNNTQPNPLFVPNPTGGIADQNKMTFRRAVTRSTSNLTGDPLTYPSTTTTFPLRLSRWLSYNYIPPGSTYADRVTISANYNPINGIAYRVEVSDPDNTPAATQPRRLLVEVTGLGPRGAQKRLSLIVNRTALDIPTPAPLVIRGHDNNSTNMHFDIGESNAKDYSGIDLTSILNGGLPPRPAFAVSAHDILTAEGAYAQKPESVAMPRIGILDYNVTTPVPGYVVVPTPWFLQTADNARLFVGQAEATARSRGRVFDSLDGYAGSASSPQITFVKGNCKLDGGGGLLIVTGTLTLKGGPNFNGIILVLGAGRVEKSGGGDGEFHGSITVARFNSTGGFLEPWYDVGGGGGSNLQSDSSSEEDARAFGGHPVLGVMEK